MKIDRKRMKRSLIYLAVQLLLLGIFFLLLRHKPSDYDPPRPDTSGRVSPYLTHDVLQNLYNNVQAGKPFELLIEEEGLRDVIATSYWSGVSGDAQLSRPTIYFRPDHIVAMMAANVQGMDFIATFTLIPEVDEQGFLHIVLDQASVGAVPMTPIVAALAHKMYMEQTGGIVGDDLLAKITDALFRQQPVDSRFVLDGKYARIDSVQVNQGNLVIGFVPAR